MQGFERDRELLGKLLQFAGLTPAALAREAGVAVTTIQRPYAGKVTTRLSQPTLDKLRKRFPDFPEWADYHGHSQPLPSPEASDIVEIAQIDLRYGLGATFLDGPIEVEKQIFSRSWLSHFTRAAPEHLFWAIGDGDSMEPTIRSGEIVLIDTSQHTPRMSEGIWAVALGDFGMIKRLHYAGRDGLQLVSDNQLIPPIMVAEDELHIVGRVVATMRRL